MKTKVVVILGPTASGKSDVAVAVALQNNGEVISADSRQVYRGLDIGSGKITHEEMRGIPHHLLDIADPRERYSVADFARDASKAVREIAERKCIPVIAGGTGFFIHALIDNIALPEVPPNEVLRKTLKDKGVEELFAELKEKDPRRAESIDPHNPRRLIRALEIVDALGAVPETTYTFPTDYSKSPYDVLQIGLSIEKDALAERIHARLLKRLGGMKKEAHTLHENGLSFERMEELGLEYRHLAYLLQEKMTEEEMLEKLEVEIRHYAKRQMTWFSRDSRIEWFSPSEFSEVKKLSEKFLSS